MVVALLVLGLFAAAVAQVEETTIPSSNSDNRKYYQHGWYGKMPCSGIDCTVPLAPVVIACVGFVMVLFATAVWLWHRHSFDKSLREGIVPASMLVSSWNTQTKNLGDTEAFHFVIHVPESRDEIKEQECPICLKQHPKSRKWIVFGCGHATCRKCFKKMVSRQKLYTNCPLCRHVIVEGDGDRGAARDDIHVHRRDGGNAVDVIAATTASSVQIPVQLRAENAEEAPQEQGGVSQRGDDRV